MVRGVAWAKKVEELPRGDGRSPLPEGWCWSTLGSVLPIEYGKALPESKRSGSGGFPVYGSSGRVGSHDQFVAPAKSIVIGRKGSAGAVYFSEEPSWPIDTAYFTAGSSAIDTRYGYWFLSYCQLGRLDQSTAIPSLSRGIYDVQSIPLAPLAEQRRIVARVEALLSDIADGEVALATARKGLEKFRRALLKAAVTGELTKDWRGSNSVATSGHDFLPRIAKGRSSKPAATGSLVKQTSAPTGLPDGWVWATLGDIAGVGTGGTPSRSYKAYWEDGSVAWFTSAATKERYAVVPNEWITERAVNETNCRVYPTGTLLVAMYGEGKTRGQITELAIPAACNQACAALQFGNESLREWVRNWFGSFYLQLRARAAGGVQPNLNLEIIKSLLVPIPQQLERAEILRRVFDALSASADTLATLDAEAANVARLKQSVLKAAFEGRLSTQEHTDEPASVLVRRMSAAIPSSRRAGRAQVKTTRTKVHS